MLDIDVNKMRTDNMPYPSPSVDTYHFWVLHPRISTAPRTTFDVELTQLVELANL
jgi:hypothetical protein